MVYTMNLKNIQQKMQREKIKIEKMFTKEIQEQKEEIVKLEQEIENLDKVIADKNRAIEDINKNINEINAYLIKETERNNHEIEKLMSEQKENTEILNKELELIKQNYNDILEAVNSSKDISREIRNINKEILWAETFNNTISDSSWLKDKSFSPGRWAVGYQYLYAVYRILNAVKPKKILELGLGQSTKLLSQYAKANKEVKHTVVEHDQEWIDFYKRENELAENTEILKLEREYRKYKNDDKVLAFKEFKENLQGQKFDFISIDAPLGANAKIYARVDVLEILPECLEEDFVIVIDDYNRKGEKNTVNEVERILKEYNISYCKGIYYGEKECMVISSKKLKFVCSM